MTYTETLNYIHSLGKFKLPATLERIKNVCEMLGNPQNEFKSVHIAGTNGKGSTAVFCSEIFKNAGYKTGLFISPFVVDFCERIQINGEYIPQNDLVKYSQKVVDTGIKLNEFEFITAVCFLCFKEKKVDIAVIETGMGGRYDATNVISSPLVSVITKIGLDHTQILGETVEKIAGEKCGIIKRGRPTVTVCNQDKKALAVIEKSAQNLVVPKMPRIIKSDLTGNEFLYENEKYSVSLLGEHQCCNAVTAIEAVKATNIKVSKENIDFAFKNAKFPARLEILKTEPLIVLDGAHNKDGAETLAGFMSRSDTKKTLVVAMMKDKNTDGFLKTVLPFADKCIVTEIENNRCESADNISSVAHKYCKDVVAEKDLKTALNIAEKQNSDIFIAGSLYLAGEVRKFYI